MKSGARKQLNIRSDEAYDTAHRLARKLGKTTQQVVVEALVEKARKEGLHASDLAPEVVAARLAGLLAARERMWTGTGPTTQSHRDDDDWLYDENGAPR
jgi:hypothetical protein